jgi:hypothetical protein
MWVELDTWLLADRRVPEVRVGESIQLQLGLVIVTAQPSHSPDDSAKLNGAILTMPRSAARPSDPRHRVRGVVATEGDSALIHADGLYIQVNEAPGLPGQLVDVIGDLTVADGPARSKSPWIVQGIMLHYAPIVVGDEATVVPVAPSTTTGGGLRAMTAAQYIDLVGSERAAANGIMPPGSTADYNQGELVTVAQAKKFPERRKGFRHRYLMDIAPTQP